MEIEIETEMKTIERVCLKDGEQRLNAEKGEILAELMINNQ